MIERTLLWTPRAKQRPRTAFKAGSYRTFTPRETQDAERALARQWVGPPLLGPITVSIDLSDTEVGLTLDSCPQPVNPKLRRGDIDNYAKLVLDALNGVAWADDRQIATLHVRKL